MILTDASNLEVDRLNARAQHHRQQRGELGDREIPHPEKPYRLREHDRVIFNAQHRPPGQPRVENGSLGHITHIHDDHGLTVALDATGREIHLSQTSSVRCASPTRSTSPSSKARPSSAPSR